MMQNRKLIYLYLTIFIAITTAFPATLAQAKPIETHAQDTSDENFVVSEGYDFATRVLQDPWDMSQFTDVSQWINHTGPENYILDLQVENGVFSGRTTSGTTYFFLLYPGYDPGLRIGKIGRKYPISTNQFNCFYISMKNNAPGVNWFQFSWADEHLPPQATGMPYGLRVKNDTWALYKVDLRNWPHISGTPWGDRAAWQALSVTPSLSENVMFSVDWARLTDCQPVNVRLNNLPAGTYSLRVQPEGSNRQILVEEAFSPQDGRYDLDVQGLQAGQYTYILSQANDPNAVVRQGQLTIQPTPILQFTQPSPVSGVDYATQSGNAWDFADSADISESRCAQTWLEGNVLHIDTLPPNQAPASCVGTGANEMDPMIFLNTPSQVSPQSFRYLSFRHAIDGAWSVPELGMVVRWVWSVQNGSTACHYYSKEFELEVGWQEYTVDLYDDWNGEPATVWPSTCPLTHWKDQTNPVISFRFEPNENITDETFHQQVDWIRLTQPGSVSQGSPFLAKMTVSNTPIDQIQSVDVFYTNDIQQPNQSVAAAYLPEASYLQANYQLFLPMLHAPGTADPFTGELKSDITFSWDTSNVSPGDYYLCARVVSDASQSLSCSSARVQVTAP